MGFFEKLVAGLGKTRDNIVSGMDSIFHGSPVSMMTFTRSWKRF